VLPRDYLSGVYIFLVDLFIFTKSSHLRAYCEVTPLEITLNARPHAGVFLPEIWLGERPRLSVVTI
jgi:hypothetical protein